MKTLIEERSRKVYSKVFPELTVATARDVGNGGGAPFLPNNAGYNSYEMRASNTSNPYPIISNGMVSRNNGNPHMMNSHGMTAASFNSSNCTPNTFNSQGMRASVSSSNCTTNTVNSQGMRASVSSSNCNPYAFNSQGTRARYNSITRNGFPNFSMQTLQESQGTEDFLPDESHVEKLPTELRSSRVSSFTSQSSHSNIERSSMLQTYSFGSTILTNSLLSSSMSVAPEHEWRERNSLYLEELEEREKSKKHHSSTSTNLLKYAQLLQAMGSDIDDDDSFDQKIDELFAPVIAKKSAQGGAEEDPMHLSMTSLANSLQMSVESNENQHNSEIARRRRSVRFSMVSQRATRMSLILRQSCVSILEDDIEVDDGEERHNQNTIHNRDNGMSQQRQSQYIPDIFWSQKERRRSSITESSAQLLAAVYGHEATEKLCSQPDRLSICLKNIVAPVTQDDIMMEIDTTP